MKKRRQLNALLQFRSRNNSGGSVKNDDLLTSSEEELFLPNTKNAAKPHTFRYRRCCNYIRHIISFCLVCIFMIVCAGLAYANVELKHEVLNLSSRVADIEKRLSSFEFNHLLTTIDSIKTRLMTVEKWNGTYIYEQLNKLHTDFNRMAARLSKVNNDDVEHEQTSPTDVELTEKLHIIEQKSSKLKEVSDELEKLEKESEGQMTNLIYSNEKSKHFDKSLIEHLLEQENKKNLEEDIVRLSSTVGSFNKTLQSAASMWKKELDDLRTDLHLLNQTLSSKEQILSDLMHSFKQLNSLVQNSSSETSRMIETFQTDINNIRNKINNCKQPQSIVEVLIPTTSTTFEQTLHSNITEQNSSSIVPIITTITDKTILIDHDRKTVAIDQNNKTNDTHNEELAYTADNNYEQKSYHINDKISVEDDDEVSYLQRLFSPRKKTKSDNEKIDISTLMEDTAQRSRKNKHHK
ncbi:unnamed protein product [Didymodactylos carnosus]|uniref:Uncharacterized protein n=1 Tax=Didymodactylos carnosus TaxID=1234261 RepID=A0A8S2DZF7_9BILA|nr:unnamed protein product [Didymodactylos carnosus]CAF3856242.1 unnamed protein product [Didymodactylos carnosus]